MTVILSPTTTGEEAIFIGVSVDGWAKKRRAMSFIMATGSYLRIEIFASVTATFHSRQMCVAAAATNDATCIGPPPDNERPPRPVLDPLLDNELRTGLSLWVIDGLGDVAELRGPASVFVAPVLWRCAPARIRRP